MADCFPNGVVIYTSNNGSVPLEPVLKLLESDESFVIPSPVSIRGGHWHVACGKSCKV
jgi:hypothetical protein